VPVTFIVCTDGDAASFTVIVAARVPTALGVNTTVNVHRAFAASVAPHGVAPPGTSAKSPLPVIVGLTALLRLLVTVTV
jgi:hypothetical protein